jgi:23S rRNA pseudouridine1911/1915/1917 synthase
VSDVEPVVDQLPVHHLEVPGPLDGERLDRVVAMVLDVSRARAAALVTGGEVTLDGEPVTVRSARVRAGQDLAVAWAGPAGPDPLAADPAVPVVVVHADADVIVVDKPAGVVVHPGSGVTGATLVNGLLARFPELGAIGAPDRPGIVHRLDRGTSGLLVVARSAVAYAALVDQLAGHHVQRRYLALVGGHVEADAGLIDAPLGRSSRDPTRRAVRHDGQPARTRYRAEERFDRPVAATLVTCELETGRTHQIRAHFQAVGHPVVGDDRYGGRPVDRLPAGRPFLHAAALGFDHPVSGEPLLFESPLPADLAGALAEFRGTGS